MPFYKVSLLISLSLVFISACGTPHAHEVPVGIILYQGEEKLLIQDEGILTYIERDAIEVLHGKYSDTISVEFIADEGHRYLPDPTEFSLVITHGNTELLGVDHPVGGDEWSFRLIGHQTGETTIRFELLHIDHFEFRSQDFDVHIRDQENSHI